VLSVTKKLIHLLVELGKVNNMEEADEILIKKWIKEDIAQAVDFKTRKVGDLPTDDNQLIPKKFIDTTFYWGIVSTPNLLPTGWTATYSPTGTCTITHNLNIAREDYTVFVNLVDIAASSQVTVYNLTTKNTNDFVITLYAVGGFAVNAAFTFLLVKKPQV
jgi:hypothetical protein